MVAKTDTGEIGDRLAEVAVGVETTKVGEGLTAVDFGLYELSERQVELEAMRERLSDETVEAVLDSGLVVEEAVERLDRLREQAETDTTRAAVTTGDFAAAGQRTGGRFKSSIVLAEGGDKVVK